MSNFLAKLSTTNLGSRPGCLLAASKEKLRKIIVIALRSFNKGGDIRTTIAIDEMAELTREAS